MRKHFLIPIHSACNIHVSRSSQHLFPNNKSFCTKAINIEQTLPYEKNMFTNEFISFNMKNYLKKKQPLKRASSSMSLNTNETDTFNYLNTRNKKHLNEGQINSLYSKIFQNRGIFRNRKKDLFHLNNILNINYAEDEKQYQIKNNDHNEKLRLKGRNSIIRHNSKVVESKLSECQDKILFMKGIVDYSYPRLVLNKTKEITKSIEKKYNTKGRKYLSPVSLRNIEKNIKNKERELYLQTSLKIISKV